MPLQPNNVRKLLSFALFWGTCSATIFFGSGDCGLHAQTTIEFGTTTKIIRSNNRASVGQAPIVDRGFQFHAVPSIDGKTPNAAGRAQVIPPTPAKALTPREDAFRLLGNRTQNPTRPEFESSQVAFQQETGEQRRGLVARPDTSEPMGVLRPNETGGVQGLQSEVKIYIDPDTGQVTLIGDAADTDLVAKALKIWQCNRPSRLPSVSCLITSPVKRSQRRSKRSYDANFAASQGRAFVRALRSPNGLYVFGTNAALESIRSIVEKLTVTRRP